MQKNEAVFQTIPEACKTTGLSKYYLRNGCKAGSVPHVRNGRLYLIDVPALVAKLRTEERTKCAQAEREAKA